MTEPREPEHPEQPPASMDEAAVAQLRSLLRDEPVEDDDLARARRIRAALDAMDPTPAAVPAARHRGPRPWLVAAAVLAVLGLGGLFAAQLATSGGGVDQASTEMADPAATPTDGDAATAEAGTSGPSGAAADRSDSAGAVSTTMVAPEASAPPPTDLGVFADAAAARAALGADAAAPGADATAGRWSGPELPCVDEQRARGAEVLGVATVGGAVRVVVRGPSGIELIDPGTCTPT